MDFYQAIILGIIQGLTEFLPVSSSGHLVIAQSLMSSDTNLFIPGFSQPGVLFDVSLHGGTLLAVILYFRKRIISLDKGMLLLLMLGSIPAGIVGFLFKDFLEGLFSNPQAVGAALLLTGGMNWLVDRTKNRERRTKGLGWKDALMVGIFQAIAIIPGISRSGSTIFAGVWRGIKKEDAAEFSFLLSIPAIGGAIFLQLIDYSGESFNYMFYFLGAVVSLVIGYTSIGLLMKLLVQRYFKVFAIYCFIVGLTTLILTI